MREQVHNQKHEVKASLPPGSPLSVVVICQIAFQGQPHPWEAGEGTRTGGDHCVPANRSALRGPVLQCQLPLLPFRLHLQQQHRGLPRKRLDRNPRQPARGHRGDVSAPVCRPSVPVSILLWELTVKNPQAFPGVPAQG